VRERLVERVVLGAGAFYIFLTLAVSAYLAYAPPDGALRGILGKLPPCAMRHNLGIPCPLCFGTTTYILIWRGRFWAALRLDPFVFVLFWVSIVLLFGLVFLAVSRRPASYWLGGVPARRWALAAAVVGALFLLNWVYLVFTHLP